MKTTITILSLTALLACQTLSAQQTQPARGVGHWLRWFPLLDKNNAGFITVEEQTVNTQPPKTP